MNGRSEASATVAAFEREVEYHERQAKVAQMARSLFVSAYTRGSVTVCKIQPFDLASLHDDAAVAPNLDRATVTMDCGDPLKVVRRLREDCVRAAEWANP